MTRQFHWTNRSVLSFADGQDPVQAMETKAREIALEAMDAGWKGPPFDPLALAEIQKIAQRPRGDIPDARLMPGEAGQITLEYNPTRPRGRLRFSIAHEIAHTFFADCADEVRNRGGDSRGTDNWQLEVLCNIGAAELLMPLGSFPQLADERVSIQRVMDIRKEFDVSVEACLIRSIKLARTPSASFCASKHDDGSYRIDYVIPAHGWKCPIQVGHVVPGDSVVLDCNAIGFTAAQTEKWIGDEAIRVECVGLAPYPGKTSPRVVGVLMSDEEWESRPPALHEVDGDALAPRGTGARLVAHVVPDTNAPWGGNGFAAQVRKRFNSSYLQFRTDTAAAGRPPQIGETYFADLGGGITIAHMVAQRGFGPSSTPRLRLSALSACLTDVRHRARELNASVHMPRVGTGHGGVEWSVVKELIADELADEGISTTVYRRP